MIGKLKHLFDSNRQELAKLTPLVRAINQFEPQIQALSKQALQAKTTEFKTRLAKGESERAILPEAFAVAREAIFRVIGEKAYDVQLLAAITLFLGKIAEQRTGEGKTHSAAIAAYLAALSGKGVHIITVNDYLARVGTGWYPQALHFLGLSISCIIHDQSFMYTPEFTDPTEKFDKRLTHLKPVSRHEAYAADITYGTNNEFGFDYLRDNMARSRAEIRQRPLHFAIVDEVDFALIDEARTPLIISFQAQEATEKYYRFAQIASSLQPADYLIDEKARSATLSEYGIRKVERVLGVGNLYEEDYDTIHYIENSIKAASLFVKDRDYVVKDGQVIIVDEFTGRLMPGRRWSDGLHQAVEAKEGVSIQKESKTAATVTFQNYFRLYARLAGMTGTAATESEEFRQIYHLETVVIPTHMPVVREDGPDQVFKTQRAKYAAIVADVEDCFARGQPVLVGTTSIDKNQLLSSYLQKKAIPHQILNAKNHVKEAQIISEAGKKGAVTIATNMAGRGVDIILGGPKPESTDGQKPSPEVVSAWQKAHAEVVALGGLRVIGTERHESRRIDNQLRGRSGRQGDKGSSQFYVSLDDDLMRIFGGEQIAGLMTRFKLPENTAIVHPLVSRALEQIQVKVEGFHFDSRKSLVDYDDVINRQRQLIYELRNRILTFADTNPDKLDDELFLRFNKETARLFTPDSTGQGSVDWTKAVLELNEILPLASAEDRHRLAERLAHEQDPIGFTNKLLADFWQKRKQDFGAKTATELLKLVFLDVLDTLWVDHLSSLDSLREGVRLRGYGQKDPLVEYRKEGFDMFQELMTKLGYNLTRRIFRVSVEAVPSESAPLDGTTTTRGKELTNPSNTSAPDIQQTTAVTKQGPSPGRNDPCPCGSGKKYKKCHINREPQTAEEREAYNLYETNRDEWNRRFGKK